MTGERPDGAATQARHLLRAARAGTLATAADGQPFASLVTPATAPDGSILMLLSDLSEHTRHLRAEPRCALMVAGTTTDANPQTMPRLTVTGQASLESDPALKARWVALHPYAAFYADFGDFNLWRLHPAAGLLVGGFARAFRLRDSELLAGEDACRAVAAAEPGVITHCNADHADALDSIAGMAGHEGSGWRMAACDVDGFDLVREERVARIDWPEPVANSSDVRSALVHLAVAARKAAVTSSGPLQPGPL